MKRMMKIARRALHWADVYRREGDAEGVAFAEARFAAAAAKMREMNDAAFLPRIEIGGVA